MPRSFTEKIFTNIARLDRRDLISYLRSAREQLELLSLILDTMNEAVLALDADQTVLYANAAVLDLLGVKKDDIMNLHVSECLRDIHLKDAVQNTGLDAYFSCTVAVSYPRALFLHLQIIPLESTRKTHAPTAQNPVPTVLLLLRDVTRERHQQTEEERASRLETLRLLTAGIAHEIGNPLSAIILHAQLMQRSVSQLPHSDTTDKCADITRVIYDESQRLKRIVADFLNAVRPLSLSLINANVRTILDETLQLLQSEIDSNDIHVVRVDEAVPDTLIDADQIRSVFINVIRNAIDAMHTRGGTLTIDTHVNGDAIVLTCRDDGIGMSNDELARVFTPYYTTKAHGSGLGMLITQRIMHAHGGAVKVESKQNNGTTVTLTFPLRLPKERQSLPSPPPPSSDA